MVSGSAGLGFAPFVGLVRTVRLDEVTTASLRVERRIRHAHTTRVLLALMVLFLLAFPIVVRVASRLARREWERIEQARTRPPVFEPPIERVTSDLRRLRILLERRENVPGTTGKGMKMGALRRAYVEVLGTACRQLDVLPPRQFGQLQVPLAEIYRVECELRERGLDVRMPDLGSQAA